MATYKTIRLISEAFDRHDIKYQIFETDQYQEIHAFFGIKIGPMVTVRYNSRDQGNDLGIRVLGLVNDVPEEKHQKLLETCNTLNGQYRFTKFCLDRNGNVSVEYDLPVSAGDESVGEMCFEIFVRFIQILNQGYSLFTDVLYRDDPMELLGGDTVDSERLPSMLNNDHDEISIRISRISSAGGSDSETPGVSDRQDETIG